MPKNRKVAPPLELIENCVFVQFNGTTNGDIFNYVEIQLSQEKKQCNNKFELLRKFYQTP